MTRPPFLPAAALAAALAALPAHAEPLSTADGCELLDENPSRGPAAGNWTVLRRDGSAPVGNPTRFFSKLWDLSEFSGGNDIGPKPPKPGRLGGADIPLTDAALDTVRKTLANARANGAQGILRFAYAWDDTIGSEPSDPAVIQGHIAQIGAVLREFPDVVFAVEGGMFGPWGEMNYSGYVAPERSVPIMNAWLRELPPATPLLVRSPCYLIWHAGMKSAEFDEAVRKGRLRNPGADRLGMYNDGYLGSMGDLGTWHGDPPPSSGLTREMGVRWLSTRKGGIPYGGEFGYCGLTWVTNRGPLCNPDLNIVREWYLTHLTYLRDFGEHQSIASFLATLPLDASLTNFPGAPHLGEWVGRDLRSFVRAHLGYRFVVRKAALPGAPLRRGDPLPLRLSVENTGFNDIRWGTRAALLLAPRDGGAEPARVPIPLDLRKASSAKTVEFPLVAKLPALPPGDYDLLLELRLDLPYPAGAEASPPAIRLANAGAWDDSRQANRLGSLRIR